MNWQYRVYYTAIEQMFLIGRVIGWWYSGIIHTGKQVRQRSFFTGLKTLFRFRSKPTHDHTLLSCTGGSLRIPPSCFKAAEEITNCILLSYTKIVQVVLSEFVSFVQPCRTRKSLSSVDGVGKASLPVWKRSCHRCNCIIVLCDGPCR